MCKLNEFGIFGNVNTSLLSVITEEQGVQLREAIVAPEDSLQLKHPW